MEKPLLVDELFSNWAPGVYRQEEFALRPSEFSTGVPVFIGTITDPKPDLTPDLKPDPKHDPVRKPKRLHLWPQFKLEVGGKDYADCMLAYAVRGFFQNGGKQCYVVPLAKAHGATLDQALSEKTLSEALQRSAALDVDLVCVPDLGLIGNTQDRSSKETSTKGHSGQTKPKHTLEALVVKHCEDMGDRFAILDSHSGATKDDVWEQWFQIDGKNGAIYYPWVRVRKFDEEGRESPVLVAPCGHVAGVYARTDRERGVHKAPANEVLDGVLDLERHLTSSDQAYLNPKRVNCIRSFPGRGIRVWGARTLSGQDTWTYVNVRRIFLTAVRWINWHMGDVAFEANDAQLWARIERELNTYFMELYRKGALKGNDPQEAFYVKCDAKTNPKEIRDLGQVVTEIGLAPAKPYEFVVVRLIHGKSGVSISGPTRPEQN